MVIVWDFFEASFGIVLEFFRIFLELFRNAIGILWEFFWNSLRILLKFFRDVWLGGSDYMSVDFG